MTLTELLTAQLELQSSHMKDGNPMVLRGDAAIEFIRWNILATGAELIEALDECNWKPWAEGDEIDHELFMKELVDAFHFFMNLMLVVGGQTMDSTEAIAEDFVEKYFAKRKVNAQRQEEGYDGKGGKCPGCKREITEESTIRMQGGDIIACKCGRTLQDNS